MISVRNLTKVYKLSKKDDSKNVVALNSVNIDFPDKGLVFLLGKSGSGKSTLLNTIGGLDTFDSGEIIIKGKSSKDFKQSDFDSYRNTFIGFIFQEYNILEEFSVGKNLAIALELQGKKADKAEVERLLETVDLKGYYKRKPNQLSGGQKQRVAIARALIKDPEIIMADEPTGALDSNTGKQVMETLKKLSQTKLVIIVSHDREFAEIYGDRIIELKDGNIIRDEVKHEVEAIKSSTGVSFIDNSIIHIKKGQKISKDDLIKINQMIVSNIKETDTIISFDDKSNKNVKKTAFITDDGNREVFKKTEIHDIKQQQHDPNNFKMIKSKLKFKDSFKMGTSSLKHKPVRLIFTIFLSVIAFAMFGVVDTMSSFDRAKSIASTVEQLNLEVVSINKNTGNSYSSFPLNSQDLNNIESNNPEYKFYKVIASGEQFSISGLTSNNTQTIQRNNISGIMEINNSIMSDLNLNLIEGSLPTQTDEICISNNMFESIKSNNNSISSFEDLKTRTMSVYLGNNWKYLTITGVIKDNTNIDKYKNLSESEIQQEHNLHSEIEVIMKYGLVNMCYTTSDNFSSLYNEFVFRDLYYNPYFEDKEYTGGGVRLEFFDKSYLSRSSIEYLKSGIDPNNLKGNQAIVNLRALTDNFYLNADEIQAQINAGLTISLSAGYSNKKAFDLEVVGYLAPFDGEIILSDEYYNKLVKGYSYVITKLKDSTSANNKLISNIENIDGGAFKFSIQCAATPILDEFGSMIEMLSKVLLYVGIGLAVFAGLMLMNFISTSIAYKKREIGVLRAIGARGKDVFSIFFSESFVICMINFIFSTITCGVVCSIINNAILNNLGITLTLLVFGIRQILLMLAVALLVAFIASFIPVYKLARKNPIDSINNR